MFYVGSRRSLEFDLALAYFRRDLHRAAFQNKKTKPKEVCIHHATVTKGVEIYIVTCKLRINRHFPQFRLRQYAILFRRSTLRCGYVCSTFFFVNLFHRVIL